MAKNQFMNFPGLSNINKQIGVGFGHKKAKKRIITMGERKWLWKQKERHICPICHKLINDYFDAEFDHKRAYAKGGATTPANTLVTHKLCNRVKGKKSLSQIKKHLGTKKTTKKKTSKKKPTKQKPTNLFGIQPIIPKFRF